MRTCSFAILAVILGVGACSKRDATQRSDSAADSSQVTQVVDAAIINDSARMVEARVSPSAADFLRVNCGVDAGFATIAAHIGGFHDVQALPIARGSSVYGSVVHLYGCPVERSIDDFEEQSGAVVAILQLRGPADNQPPYTNIGLNTTNHGFYCVVVKKGADDSWQASVTRVPSGFTCPAPTFGVVKVRREVEEAGASYPKAVRIVDGAGRLPFIGVPCGGAWCEIGMNLGAYQRPGHYVGRGSVSENAKGWHDEQQVAYGGGTGSLRRGARASIIPEAGIAAPPTDAYVTPHPQGTGVIGMKVATIWFQGDPVDKYEESWGLRGGRTSVWLRRIDVSGRPTLQAQFTRSQYPDPVGTWFLVAHADHRNIEIPSTARWLWNPEDETIWLACEQGCCEVTHTGFGFVGGKWVELPPKPSAGRK